MLNRTTLLGAVGAAALTAIPYTSAMAAAPMGFAGTVSGAYSHTSDSSGGPDTNNWNINGAGAFGLSPDFGAQVDGGYEHASGGGTDLDIWTIEGSAFWAPAFGRIGGTVGYGSADFGGGFDVSVWTYGGFGEFYAGNFVTLGGHAGGFSWDVAGFSDTGWYLGGGITGYVIPNLALTGTIDYYDVSGSNWTAYTVGAEWQVSDAVPVSIFGGYQNTQFSGGGGHADTWLVGVKFYIGGNGMPLVANQRNGTLGWVGKPLGSFSF